jgi:hypothetical protein
MKIAINLSGHTRHYKGEPYENLKKKILDKYDCDVFISTWKQTGSNRRFSIKPLEKSNNDLFNEAEILDLYRPKKYEIHDENVDFVDDYIKWYSHLGCDLTTHHGDWIYEYKLEPYNNFSIAAIMLHKIMSCNSLIKKYMEETHVWYDYILRIRFDVVYTHFDLSSITDNNYLYFWTHPTLPEVLGVCDSFWIGGVAPTFLMADKFYERLEQMKNETAYDYANNEHWLYKFLLSSNIPYKANNNFMFYDGRVFSGPRQMHVKC